MILQVWTPKHLLRRLLGVPNTFYGRNNKRPLFHYSYVLGGSVQNLATAPKSCTGHSPTEQHNIELLMAEIMLTTRGGHEKKDQIQFQFTGCLIMIPIFCDNP